MSTQPVITENPLKGFFRKSKFRITLPSAGRWYPPNSLTTNPDGSLDVYAMNANDDMRFKTGELSLTGKSTVELIKSCLPGITAPDKIPSIDIDSILLAIRAASYGNEFTTNISVPGTALVRKLTFSISTLLNNIPNNPDEWDTGLTITNEDRLQLVLKLTPLNLGQLFSLTKMVSAQQNAMRNLMGENIASLTDEQAQKFDNGLMEITESAINLVVNSIETVKVIDASGKTLTNISAEDAISKTQIKQLISNMDVIYFNTIRDHLETQRKKYTITTGMVTSTDDEINAGAPETWSADIVFGGSEFFGK